MPAETDFYEVLGLSEDASSDDIRRSYFEAARRLHPDVNHTPGSSELFLKVQKAYEVLSDPAQRAGYDALRVKLAGTNVLAVTTKTLYSRSVLPRLAEPQLVYTLLELAPNPKFAPPASPPLNICLLLDRSTSMQGERMDTVKAAAIELVRQIRPQDILSIVVFGDRAEVLLPAGQPMEKSEIITQIRMIRTGGGTEIGNGLQAGFFEVRRNLSKGSINHLILLTDGQTYGDQAICQEIAEQAAESGIRITGLGIGSEWNDVFLDKIASRTGGTSFYVSSAADIQTLLQEKFCSLNSEFSDQVSLLLSTGSDVELHAVYRLQPEATPLPVNPLLRLGSLPRNGSLTALFEFIVSPVSPEAWQISLASGTLSLNIPSQPDQDTNIKFNWRRMVSTVSNTEFPPLPIFEALSQVTLYRMQDAAREEAGAGNFEQASRRLHYLATHLLSQGNRELAHAVLVEAGRLAHTSSFSEEGEKRIKYGTRALLLPGKQGKIL